MLFNKKCELFFFKHRSIDVIVITYKHCKFYIYPDLEKIFKYVNNNFTEKFEFQNRNEFILKFIDNFYNDSYDLFEIYKKKFFNADTTIKLFWDEVKMFIKNNEEILTETTNNYDDFFFIKIFC